MPADRRKKIGNYIIELSQYYRGPGKGFSGIITIADKEGQILTQRTGFAKTQLKIYNKIRSASQLKRYCSTHLKRADMGDMRCEV